MRPLFGRFRSLAFLVCSMCITPMTARHKYTGEWNTFPCGRCPECTARRASGWSFRLVQQGRVSESSMFVTLTYNWLHLEFTKNGFRSLNKVTAQCFFKRLRKKYPPKTIKYYIVGEYGGKRGRPHYHIILFNATQQGVLDAWRDSDGQPIGDVHFGTVTEASIGYCLKYISKERKKKSFARDDRLPEFALMSKGLGANYMTDAMIGWHKEDLLNRMYCTVPHSGGKKITMPRYYKDKMYSRTEVFTTGGGNGVLPVHIMTVKGERERIGEYALKRNEELAEDELIKSLEEYGDDWERVKVERDIYLFQKMYRDAERGKGKADRDDQ